MRSYAAACAPRSQQTTSKVPASRSPFAITVANPPAAWTARISPATSRWAGRRASTGSGRSAVAGQAGQRDVRAHEGAGAAADFLALGVDQMRFGDEHAPFAADPAAFGDDFAAADRLGEVQVERGGQQEPVADQRIRGVERRVVEHLEVDRAVRGAGS